MKITFLVGLPGSGKTHLGNELAESEDAVYLDDISVKEDPLNDIKLSMGVQRIVISDVFLCREKEREKAAKAVNRIAAKEGFEYDLEWVFFENNPEKCLNNVAHRNKGGDARGVSELIGQLTKEYKIPLGVIPKEIWNCRVV